MPSPCVLISDVAVLWTRRQNKSDTHIYGRPLRKMDHKWNLKNWKLGPNVLSDARQRHKSKESNQVSPTSPFLLNRTGQRPTNTSEAMRCEMRDPEVQHEAPSVPQTNKKLTLEQKEQKWHHGLWSLRRRSASAPAWLGLALLGFLSQLLQLNVWGTGS